jgi:hypothetical protein
MTTRIIFNGQEYPSTEAMPEDIRNAYLQALTVLRDADANGIPDILEAGSAHTVIGVQQSSVNFNGRTLQSVGELPVWLRHVVHFATGQEGASSTGEPKPPGTGPSEGLDTAQSTMGVFLAFIAGFVLIFSVGLMFAIGGGRNHLAGRLTVATAALLLLGWLDTQATRIARRRQPLLAPDTAGYRRFAVWSSFGLLLASALLLGLAWFLP